MVQRFIRRMLMIPDYISSSLHTLHKKDKDICQYLDENTKIKANSQNCTKHLENFKKKKNINFLCSVSISTYPV